MKSISQEIGFGDGGLEASPGDPGDAQGQHQGNLIEGENSTLCSPLIGTLDSEDSFTPSTPGRTKLDKLVEKYKKTTYGTKLTDNFSVPFSKDLILKYPILFEIYNRLHDCGENYHIFLDIDNGETIELPVYCDNRCCLNPECQGHRRYKYMKEHKSQIRSLDKDMKNPKAWVFTTPRKKYPIDKDFIRSRMKLLNKILDIRKHRKYGSVSQFSIHMEIKPYPADNRYPYETWFLHFHVVSAGVKNLRLVHKLWGYVIRFETAISPEFLALYVSKYASKTPRFPSLESFCEYAQNVYKTQMHRFSCKTSELHEGSSRNLELLWSSHCEDWNKCPTVGDVIRFFSSYLNDYGYGG